MDTQDIEDTLREFALAFNGEANEGSLPQGFASRLTCLANDMKRYREFCADVQPDPGKRLALMAKDGSAQK